MYGEEEKRDSKKIDLKTQKYSEPIPPTQREMHPSLTKRDVLRQWKKKCWMKWKCQNLNTKCPDVSGLCPSSVECSFWVAPRLGNEFEFWKLRFARARELQMKWKSALRPFSWHVPNRKMRRISCLFLYLFPSQSLIPRTRASAVVCPLELKCSATGKPGVFLSMLRRCSPKRFHRVRPVSPM